MENKKYYVPRLKEDADSDITFDNIKKLGYLDCILLEVSRVFCVLPGYFQR